MYEYSASVVKVVDGDTIWLDIDLGFEVRQRHSVRLADINAPEHGTPEGDAATAWLIARLTNINKVLITTIKDRREKYGRYLVVLWIGTTNVNEEMVAAGHAVHYSGGKR